MRLKMRLHCGQLDCLKVGLVRLLMQVAKMRKSAPKRQKTRIWDGIFAERNCASALGMGPRDRPWEGAKKEKYKFHHVCDNIGRLSLRMDVFSHTVIPSWGYSFFCRLPLLHLFFCGFSHTLDKNYKFFTKHVLNHLPSTCLAIATGFIFTLTLH